MKECYNNLFLDFTREIRKFRARNPVHQGMNFGVRNVLKLTYEHLEVQKNFRGLRPLGTQAKGRRTVGIGRGGVEKREGRLGKGMDKGEWKGRGREGGERRREERERKG
jgi:hypothetical protein